MQVLNGSKFLDSILQRLGKLSKCRVHLYPCILDGFTLRMHCIFNTKVLSIRTVVLHCCYLSLSTRSCIFYLSIRRNWHLLSLLLFTVLLISLLEAIRKLLHRIEQAVLEAFFVLTGNRFGRCLFGELDELFFLLFQLWFKGARLVLESELVTCAQGRLALLFVDLTGSHFLGQPKRILTKQQKGSAMRQQNKIGNSDKERCENHYVVMWNSWELIYFALTGK